MICFRLPTLLAVALTAALATAGPAAAGATRYAAPGSGDRAGSCGTPEAACEIEHAIEGAGAGDEIVVLPGTYNVGEASIHPSQAVTVRGVDTASRPTIIGHPPLLGGSVLEVESGSTLRDLRVESRTQGTAISLQGATGERVIGMVSGGSGDAKGIQLKNNTNLLRDSIAASDAPGGAGLQIKDGTNTAIGVTAVGTNGADGLDTKIVTGAAVVKNSIITGAKDLDLSQGASPTISWSNWRAANSVGGTDGGNNQTAAPTFCATRGPYYPAPGSPTINAATADAAAGNVDVDGASRSLGGGPDIGAYDYADGGCPPEPVNGTGGDGTGTGESTVLPPKSEPVLGTSVTLGEVKGRPRVKLPGSDKFLPLTADSTVPVGAIVDTTKGTIELTSVRDRSGKTQTGQFNGGVFQIRQSKGDPTTELALTGGSFAGCPTAKRRGKLVAAGRRHSSTVRRLWGRDRGGRFRTRGRHGSATVRGTRWLTADRCDGTLVKVTEGAVDVRDNGKRKTVRVKRGKSYLALAKAARARR